MVRFLNYRELRNTPSTVWDALDAGDAIAIVSNGEPRALMLPIENGDVEAAMQFVRRVQAQQALARIHAESARRGLDAMDDEAIDAEIAAARAERKTRRPA